LVQIDVFTSKRLQRNPLSVFTDARGLSDSEMQDLARETIQCGPVIFSNPEVMSSSVGLVPTNALVLTEPINSETIVREHLVVWLTSGVRLPRNGVVGSER
jgi:hypothetical protein